MSDIAKWALLAAAIALLIAMIVALPFMEFINFGKFGEAINTILQFCGSAFQGARGLINNFFSPFGRTLITGLLYYWFGKFFITIGIKVTSWAYHFIFK